MITFPRFVLLSLALFGDIWSVLPNSKGQAVDFWFGQRVQFHKRKSLVNVVNRLLKADEISKKVEKGQVKIQITPKGLKTLGTVNFNLEKFAQKQWDGKWRSVIFDIEEKNKKDRQWVRNELKYLGFGMLQESVWISPYPVEKEIDEYLRSRNLTGSVLVTVSKVLVGDPKSLAAAVWQLNRINSEYLELCENWASRKAKEDVNEAYEFEKNYFDLLLADPFLPRGLLPSPWYADSAKKAYKQEVMKILSQKA